MRGEADSPGAPRTPALLFSPPVFPKPEGNFHVNGGDVDDRGAPLDARRLRGLQRRWVRRVVSAWLVLHLVAIVASPAATEPASELASDLCGYLMPYLGALYLDHGYHFFAPEPVESTLIRYVAERKDGTVVEGVIPDRKTQPRLLYHRYFMLTERMSEAPEGLEELWQESYAHRIAQEHDAVKVTLFERIHQLPTMEKVREGGRLDEPESYDEEELGVFE